MAGRGRAKTSPDSIKAAERQAEAMRLRRSGATFESIAKACGYSNASGAFVAVRAGLDKALREPADELRQLEADRLDELLESVYSRALGGDGDALAATLKICERRARLFGLDRRDAPIKVDGLPKLEKAADALTLVGQLVAKTAAGELSPDEAGRLAGLVGSFVKVTEAVDLTKRIEALEGKNGIVGTTA
jgi:hypothetical protein